MFTDAITAPWNGARAAVALLAVLFLMPLGTSAAPDQIFFGGPIITLDPRERIAEALAVEGGRIVAVGRESVVRALADGDTALVDLEGQVLLPGFVDSHSHANFLGLQAMSANLLPAPDGRGNSVAALQELLNEYVATEPALLRDIGWIVGFGYDDSQLAEGRHPTREELDAVSSDIPIIIIHQSGHLGVANSLGLKLSGVDAETPDPKGGAFRREDDGRTPNGVAEEYAFFQLMFAALAKVDEGLQDRMLLAGLESMARFGFTTAQEGRASAEAMEAMARVSARGELPIDLVSYPDMLMVEDIAPSQDYANRYRVGGVKLTIDGSPQGKTAWLTRPYHVPPMGQGEDYVGYAAIDAKTTRGSILRAFANDWQILVHANGDAAIDALIDGVRAARKAFPGVDNRPVLIHGQTLRKDQVAALDELDVFPSLFPMHTFYWGDWHRDSVLGPERAENISPTGWIRERDMMFGSHHDAPVALPDSMRVLSATVTRQTRTGSVLGPEHRVDVLTALRALTIWPAWQHFEEDQKGTLEVGKLADLVVLSEDPRAIDPEKLAGIQVMATYKEGTAVFRATDQP